MPRPFVPFFVAFVRRVALKGLESPAGDSSMVQLPHSKAGGPLLHMLLHHQPGSGSEYRRGNMWKSNDPSGVWKGLQFLSWRVKRRTGDRWVSGIYQTQHKILTGHASL